MPIQLCLPKPLPETEKGTITGNIDVQARFVTQIGSFDGQPDHGWSNDCDFDFRKSVPALHLASHCPSIFLPLNLLNFHQRKDLARWYCIGIRCPTDSGPRRITGCGPPCNASLLVGYCNAPGHLVDFHTPMGRFQIQRLSDIGYCHSNRDGDFLSISPEPKRLGVMFLSDSAA